MIRANLGLYRLVFENIEKMQKASKIKGFKEENR